jgi:hypothetical protein
MPTIIIFLFSFALISYLNKMANRNRFKKSEESHSESDRDCGQLKTSLEGKR